MLTTGIFTVHKVRVPVNKLNEPIYLIPFGDVHRSSPMHCHEHWKEFLEWGSKKPRALFIGMGDYDDMLSTSERTIIINPNIHDSTRQTLEDVYTSNVQRLSKELNFMKGRVIGFIEGNHFGQFADGTTTTQRLCANLNSTYLGVSSFIRLIFQFGNTHMRTAVDIWAHHGKGAARLVGGSMNRVQQMAEAADAHIFLMGHDHKKSVGMSSKLTLSEASGHLKVKHKKQLYIRTGSFLKGYEENKPSYVADGAMNPTDLGVVKIEMTPKRDRTKGTNDFYIDLHASI